MHIDDGSMGGGGPIPHSDYLYVYSKSSYPGYTEYPSFYDYKDDPGYFNPSREGIFHYCIICHYGYDQSDDSTGFTGISDTPGVDIQLADGRMSNYKTLEWAKTLIHELGHNLGLDHPSDNDNPKKIYTSMYQGKRSIVNYGTDSHARDYLGNPIPGGNEWQYVSDHLGDHL